MVDSQMKDTRNWSEGSFDEWERKMDQEILKYLKDHAGDQYDPDGKIYQSVCKTDAPVDSAVDSRVHGC